MRKLKTSDIPSLCRSIKKLGLKEKFKTLAQEANSGQEAWDRGFNLLWDLFDVATETEGESAIYDFLAGPFEMTPEEVRDLDLDVLITNVKQLAEDNNLTGFFRSAARLMR